MKKLFLATVLLVAAATGIHAQPPGQQPPPKPTVQQRLNRLSDTLAKALHISPAQQQSINEAYTSFFAEADKLMDGAPPPPPPPPAKDKEKLDKMHSQLQALQKKRDDAVAKVLSSSDFEKYQQIEKSLKPGGGPGGPGGHQGPPPAPKPQ